jgi:hypothetical protein
MNWKVVVVVLILGAAGFFGYRQWSGTRDALKVFCHRMMQCSSPGDFAEEYGDLEGCIESGAAERTLEEFDGCDPTDDCDDWLACGLGEGKEANRPGVEKSKTHFEEVLPHIE